jgi:hypothetical protein
MVDCSIGRKNPPGIPEAAAAEAAISPDRLTAADLVGSGRIVCPGRILKQVFQHRLHEERKRALQKQSGSGTVRGKRKKYSGKFVQPAQPAGQALSVTDGRQYLRRNSGTFDQIWIDAFNSDYIPAHMTTREFFELCRSRLTRYGIVVQNVHNSNQLFDAQVTTFRSVFRYVYVFEGTHSSNSIIVAAREPLHTPPRFCGEHCRIGIGPIDLVRESRKYNPTPAIRKERILTDDFNPANLLLNRK